MTPAMASVETSPSSPRRCLAPLDAASKARIPFPFYRESISLFQRHPDIYYWKTCLFSPAVLRASNIPCYSVLQTQGTFVIVLPSASHHAANAA